MKKKILISLFTLSILAVIGKNIDINFNNEYTNALIGMNVEALASDKEGGSERFQTQGYCTMWLLKNKCTTTKTLQHCIHDCD